MMPSVPRSALRGLALGALLAAGPAVEAGAQAPADRAALEQFRDSLAAVSDSAALLRLERELIEVARADRNDALHHLRLGFVALRLGEVSGRRHFDDAASEFQWAIDLQPQWPYAWFGMGLAEYGVGDSEVSVVAGLKSMLGKDALTRSALAFARAAEVDPEFVYGLTELAATALRQRVNLKLDVALEALRRASGTPAARNPGVLLARGRIEREVGDADSALAAFEAYLRTGANPGLARLEVARTRFVLGQPAGAESYYAGAASDDSTTVAAYRADLEPIATANELVEYDRSRGETRARFLRRFWGDRDRVDLRSSGERLMEHYRRLSYARRNFALASLNRHYGIVERFRSGSSDFDDRGIIYIRHGEPTRRASYTGPDVEPNESWLYERPEGDLVFHFIAREDVQDYKLVESVFDVLGFSNAVVLGAQRDALGASHAASQLLTSRERLSPIYGRLQATGGVSSQQYQAQERQLGKRSIALGTTTDSYGLHFARDLEVKADVLALGGEGDGGSVQIAYAIAGSSLVPVQVSQGYLYSIRVRFVATDAEGRVRAALDTTRHFLASSPVPDGEHLVGHLAVPAPAGELAYRIAVQQGDDAGVVQPLDSVRVMPPAPGELTLSDLVLGARSTNLSWARTGRDTVYFNPLRIFRKSEPLHLYYEVGGLPEGQRYQTKLEVRKEGGGGGFLRKLFGGGGALSVEFEEPARSERMPVQRTISLDGLKTGSYTLEITVSDGEQEVKRRSVPFRVAGD